MKRNIKYAQSVAFIAVLLVVAVCAGMFLGLQSPSGKTTNIVAEEGQNSQTLPTASAGVEEEILENGAVSSSYNNTTGTDVTNDINSIRNTDASGNYYIAREQNITITTFATSGTFSGTLDGNGSTITLKMTDSGNGTAVVGGLFAYFTGTIKNLNIVVETFSFTATAHKAYIGLIVGEASGNATFENVKLTVNYIPSNTGNNTTTLYYARNPHEMDKDALLALGGFAGKASALNVTDCTFYNNATGDIGFSVMARTKNGWFLDKVSSTQMLGAFVAELNGNATMTNITVDGDPQAKFLVGNTGGNDRNNYGRAGIFVGQQTSGTLTINGLIMAFRCDLDSNFLKPNITEAKIGLIVGRTTGGNHSFKDFYLVSNGQQDWLLGDNQGAFPGYITFAQGQILRFSGDNVAYSGLSTQAINSPDLVYELQNGPTAVSVWQALALKDGETSKAVWVTFPKNNLDLNGVKTEFVSNSKMMNQGKIALTTSFELSQDSTGGAYKSSKIYDGQNVAVPQLILQTGDGVQKATLDNAYVEQDANHNVGTHALVYSQQNVESAGYSEYVYNGVTYLINSNGEGWVYTAGTIKVNNKNAIYNIKNGFEITVDKLDITIGFDTDALQGIIYGDTLEIVKAKNPAVVLSVGNESGVAPDSLDYSIGGYVEKTNAGTEVVLTIENVILGGNQDNYNITINDTYTAVIQKFEITGALEQSQFTSIEINDGKTVVYIPSVTTPDEITYTYTFATSPDSSEWTEGMPQEPNRYYVVIGGYDTTNYNMAENMFSFTIISAVELYLTDKVVDGTYTIEYVNTLEKLQALLEQAVDYEAEVHEGVFVFSIAEVQIDAPLNVQEQAYAITAKLESERYVADSISFNLVVNKQVVTNGVNGNFAQLSNSVYDGQAKDYKFVTEDEFAINYTVMYNGALVEDGIMKNAGTYTVSATSGDANYDIQGATDFEYVVEKATPTIDYTSKQFTIAYGDSELSGDFAPVITGVYDAHSYNTVILNGEAVYEAGSVNAGAGVFVTTQDFAISENAENYNEAVIIGKEIVVGKRGVTVATQDKTIVYGDENTYLATDFYTSVDGLFGTDSVEASYTTDYVAGVDAGTVCEVVLNFTFTSGLEENYMFAAKASVTANLIVEKRAISGTINAQNTAYNGLPYAGATITSEGIFGDDVVNAIFEYAQTENGTYIKYAPIDMGTYWVKVVGFDDNNYTMAEGSFTTAVQFTIEGNPAPTINVTVKDNIVYRGSEYPVDEVIEYTVEGVAETDDYVVNVEVNDTIKFAGEYTVTLTLGYLENYEQAEPVVVTVVVAPAELTVTLKDNTVAYGDALTGKEVYYGYVKGLQGDDEFVVTAQTYTQEYIAGTTEAGTQIPVNIEYTLDNADSYVVNNSQALVSYLNVEKKIIRGALSVSDKTYDGTANTATIIWGEEGNYGVEGVIQYYRDNTLLDSAPVNAGTYTATVAQTDNKNYEFDIKSAEFDIKKAEAPVISYVANNNLVYNGSEFALADTLTVNVDGLIEADKALANNVVLKCNSTILDAGVYSITLSLSGLENYQNAKSVIAKVTVQKAAAPTITAEALTIVYNGSTINPKDAVKVSVSGLLTGDEYVADSVQVLCDKSISDVGEYVVNVMLKDMKNYNDAQSVAVTVSVVKGENTIEAQVRMGYNYIEIDVENRNLVEYSFDGTTWTALPSDARIAINICPQIDVYVKYIATDNTTETQPVKLTAYITYNVIEEYVGRNFANAEVGFENANAIKEALSWESVATGEKSDTYDQIVGKVRTDYNALIDSATQVVTGAVNAGATMIGVNSLTVAVASLSVGGLVIAIGALAIKRRKGGKNND